MSALTRRQCLRVALGLGTGSVSALSAARTDGRLQWRERALLGFGTRLWLRAAHEDEGRLEASLDAAVQAIRHVERQMSLFDENSAACQLNREGVLHKVDPDLLRVLGLAAQIAARSAGAFDITMQPLWQVWAAAQREGRLPGATELRQARALVDWRALRIEGQAVFLDRPGMAISLNGIAQGYAADLARARLQAHGIRHALLDTGEWSPLGWGPDNTPWVLGVADPHVPGGAALQTRLISDGRAMATSSDAHSVFSADRRHHHIIDPRSGYSPTIWSSVTVLAPSCALADGLTKVMFMAPASQALALAQQWGVDVLLIDKAGRWQGSSGLPLRRAGSAREPSF